MCPYYWILIYDFMVLDTISSTATDTITALATQPGGAIGVVRVSGTKAIELTEKVFRGVGKKPLHEAKGNTTRTEKRLMMFL